MELSENRLRGQAGGIGAVSTGGPGVHPETPETENGECLYIIQTLKKQKVCLSYPETPETENG